MNVINRTIERALAPLRRRISHMLVRALVTSVNDDVKRQTLQVKIRADESADDIEHFQNYGTSSHPPLRSEAVLAALGGNLGQLVAIAVENKDFRPQGEMGDVFLYHMEGQRIRLTKDGVINITANKVNLSASERVTIVSPETTITSTTKIEGTLHVTDGITTDADVMALGSVTATGAITSSAVVSGSNLMASGISYLGHKHVYETDKITQGPL